MNDYFFAKFTDNNNKDIQGFELRCGNEHLDSFSYNTDQISHFDLVKKKKEFFNFICSKYTDIDRRRLLMVFAYTDDDMLEYYKSEYPIKELQKSGNWYIKDCPKRTERYYKKLTVDEKMFIDIALQKFRERFGYEVSLY